MLSQMRVAAAIVVCLLSAFPLTHAQLQYHCNCRQYYAFPTSGDKVVSISTVCTITGGSGALGTTGNPYVPECNCHTAQGPVPCDGASRSLTVTSEGSHLGVWMMDATVYPWPNLTINMDQNLTDQTCQRVTSGLLTGDPVGCGGGVGVRFLNQSTTVLLNNGLTCETCETCGDLCTPGALPPTAGGFSVVFQSNTYWQHCVNDAPCVIPVDCTVTPFTCDECNTTCGGGNQTCTRNVILNPQNGGTPCPHLSEVRTCNTDPCECGVGNATCGNCSAECDTGTQLCERNVTLNGLNESECPLPEYNQTCNTNPCDQDCVLSNYTCTTTQVCTRTVVTEKVGNGLPCASTFYSAVLENGTCVCPSASAEAYQEALSSYVADDFGFLMDPENCTEEILSLNSQLEECNATCVNTTVTAKADDVLEDPRFVAAAALAGIFGTLLALESVFVATLVWSNPGIMSAMYGAVPQHP